MRLARDIGSLFKCKKDLVLDIQHYYYKVISLNITLQNDREGTRSINGVFRSMNYITHWLTWAMMSVNSVTNHICESVC